MDFLTICYANIYYARICYIHFINKYSYEIQYSWSFTSLEGGKFFYGLFLISRLKKLNKKLIKSIKL